MLQVVHDATQVCAQADKIIGRRLGTIQRHRKAANAKVEQSINGLRSQQHAVGQQVDIVGLVGARLFYPRQQLKKDWGHQALATVGKGKVVSGGQRFLQRVQKPRLHGLGATLRRALWRFGDAVLAAQIAALGNGQVQVGRKRKRCQLTIAEGLRALRTIVQGQVAKPLLYWGGRMPLHQHRRVGTQPKLLAALIELYVAQREQQCAA